MKGFTITVMAVAVLAVPAAAMAKPSKADVRAASAECRAEREAMGKENFRALNGNLGKCVKLTAREERTERKQARRQAVKDCKAQGLEGRDLRQCVRAGARANKAQADEVDAAELNAAALCHAEQEDEEFELAHGASFADHYGTNHNKKNAFGKCVSKLAQELGDDTEVEEEELEHEEEEVELEDVDADDLTEDLDPEDVPPTE